MGDFRFSLRHGNYSNLKNSPNEAIDHLYEPLFIFRDDLYDGTKWDEDSDHAYQLAIIIENSLYKALKAKATNQPYPKDIDSMIPQGISINGNWITCHLSDIGDVEIYKYAIFDIYDYCEQRIWDKEISD